MTIMYTYIYMYIYYVFYSWARTCRMVSKPINILYFNRLFREIKLYFLPLRFSVVYFNVSEEIRLQRWERVL